MASFPLLLRSPAVAHQSHRLPNSITLLISHTAIQRLQSISGYNNGRHERSRLMRWEWNQEAFETPVRIGSHQIPLRGPGWQGCGCLSHPRDVLEE
jgi:hypothetical protein